MLSLTRVVYVETAKEYAVYIKTDDSTKTITVTPYVSPYDGANLHENDDSYWFPVSNAIVYNFDNKGSRVIIDGRSLPKAKYLKLYIESNIENEDIPPVEIIIV